MNDDEYNPIGYMCVGMKYCDFCREWHMLAAAWMD